MPTPPPTGAYTPPTLFGRFSTVLGACHRILTHDQAYYDFDDLALVQDGLDGPAFRTAADKMLADPEGARMMAERTELSLRTVDWYRLSQLPIDTLGYNLWHHFYANELFYEVVLGPPIVRWDDETEYAKRRYRATHDLRHVMVGLGPAPHEEVLLQTFQYNQLPQKLSWLIVFFGTLKHGLVDGFWRELADGLPKARRSAIDGQFLSNVPFEELWEVPLEEVRRQFGIRAVGDAYPVAERHPDAPCAPQWDAPAVEAVG
jgi:ubiquinone biosynthesis protein Coq4